MNRSALAALALIRRTGGEQGLGAHAVEKEATQADVAALIAVEELEHSAATAGARVEWGGEQLSDTAPR